MITPSFENVSNVTVGVQYIREGKAPTVKFYPQSEWNIDTCKPMGSLQKNYDKNKSGFELLPSLGNVYKIAFQYLGFGAITFFIEITESETLVPVHRIKYANTELKPSLKNPNMQVGIGIQQSGNVAVSTTVETSSMASFVQGNVILTGLNRSYGNLITTNTTTGMALTTRAKPAILFGLKNIPVFESTNSDGNKNYAINNNNIVLSTINFSANAASNITANIIFMLIKNPTNIELLSEGTYYPPFTKYNDDLIQAFNGLVVTSGPSGSSGIVTIGGTIILEFAVSENQNITEMISGLNLEMSKYDSYYLCFYGKSSNDVDILGSLSYQINM